MAITIAAAFFQNLRSALQKHLKGRLSTSGAAYVRFFYAWPMALVYVYALHAWGDLPLPRPNTLFLLYCVLGSVAQILFTVFLLWMFSYRNFAVGTTFSKLEVVQVAILGAIILGDRLSAVAVVAIVVSAFGVVAMSIGQSKVTLRALLGGFSEKPTLIGLACAAFVGGSVVFFRGASLALQHDNAAMAAAYALAVSLLIQTLLMGAYLRWREPGELTRVIRHWRWAGAVGVTAVLGSIGWFSAFTLENAAHVRALGQIELVFTYIATTLVFREHVNWRETLGMVLVVAGILLLILGG
ncbi:MAG: EamA family transporter [Gammaproteobacteria bacterium]|nr:EamA family transporter [Gammaproteobacteria bacterium]